MISKCANPACSNRFFYLHEGKLFLRAGGEEDTKLLLGLSTPSAQTFKSVEFFWLCTSCAAR